MTGLPNPSLDLSPLSDTRPEDPTQAYWLAPVLHVLAEKSQYRPRILVDDTDELWREVIEVAGYDTSKPHTLPRPFDRKRKGPGRKQGLISVAYYAAFYARGDIARPAPIPLIVKDGKRWGLTEAGVAVAARVRPHFATDGRNVTCVWLDGQFKHHGLRERMVKTVSFDPSTAREREAKEIDDHIGHYVAVSIHRDSYRTRLETCDPPTWRQIKEWLLRATWSTFKKRAREPLMREARGARTETERESGETSVAAMAVTSFAKIQQTTDCVRSEATVVSEEMVDYDATRREIHRVEFDKGMDKVSEAFRRHKPGNHGRIEKIFHLMAEGHTVAEIGTLLGVSRNRAATLMADTRKALRDAETASLDALVLIQYLVENPCSTDEDIQNDVIVTTSLSFLVDGLLENGRIEGKEFTVKRRVNGKVKVVTVTGYLATERGLAFVEGRTRRTGTPDDIFDRISL